MFTEMFKDAIKDQVPYLMAFLLVCLLWPVARFMYRESRRVKGLVEDVNRQLFWENIKILSYSNTFFGYGANELLKERRNFPEWRVYQTVYDIQKQIRENEPLMMQILGSAFSYFNNFNLNGYEPENNAQGGCNDKIFTQAKPKFDGDHWPDFVEA